MLIHEYETIYVVRPDLDEADSERIHEKINNAITQAGGEILVREDWGRRKMAYIIRKQIQGHYVYLNYVGEAGVPVQFERQANLEDNLVRYITVRLGENVDAEERRVIAEERQRKRAEKAAHEAQLREQREARNAEMNARAERHERERAARAEAAAAKEAAAQDEAVQEEAAQEEAPASAE